MVQKQSSPPVNASGAPPRRKIPFMKVMGFFTILSVSVFAAGVFFIFTHGFNFGTDFMGGVKLLYQFSEPVTEEPLRNILLSMGFEDPQVVRYGDPSERSFLVKVKLLGDKDVPRLITEKFREDLPGNAVAVLSEETVGPKVGAELRRDGLVAVIITVIAILLYIVWRFDFLFSLGAIIALSYDTLIALGAFCLLHKEFNLSILAAVLTLIGYSINDKIIIFDRIRENLRKLPPNYPLKDLIDLSLNEILSRSVVTSLTVLFAVGILFAYAGGVIHDFAFLMCMGVIVGTYSTIFVAAPFYYWVHHLLPQKLLAKTIRRR